MSFHDCLHSGIAPEQIISLLKLHDFFLITLTNLRKCFELSSNTVNQRLQRFCGVCVNFRHVLLHAAVAVVFSNTASTKNLYLTCVSKKLIFNLCLHHQVSKVSLFSKSQWFFPNIFWLSFTIIYYHHNFYIGV